MDKVERLFAKNLSASKARARCRFSGNYLIVGFATQLFANEWADESAEVRAAAGATDDDVGLDAVFVESGFCFQTNHCLVQKHLV